MTEQKTKICTVTASIYTPVGRSVVSLKDIAIFSTLSLSRIGLGNLVPLLLLLGPRTMTCGTPVNLVPPVRISIVPCHILTLINNWTLLLYIAGVPMTVTVELFHPRMQAGRGSSLKCSSPNMYFLKCEILSLNPCADMISLVLRFFFFLQHSHWNDLSWFCNGVFRSRWESIRAPGLMGGKFLFIRPLCKMCDFCFCVGLYLIAFRCWFMCHFFPVLFSILVLLLCWCENLGGLVVNWFWKQISIERVRIVMLNGWKRGAICDVLEAKHWKNCFIILIILKRIQANDILKEILQI